MNITDLCKEDIEKFLKEERPIKQILEDLGYSSNGSGAYKQFKNYCRSLGITYELKRKGNGGKFHPEAKPEEVFILNSTFAPTHLKRKIIKYDLIPYICTKCHNKGEWLNEKLVLQLDHVNGNNSDNRLENLQFLCPNCHSQTETFSCKRDRKNKSIG